MSNSELCVFWLNGLFLLKDHANPTIRQYVRELLSDAGLPGISVSEVLEPLMNFPDSGLTDVEKYVKRTVLNRNK